MKKNHAENTGSGNGHSINCACNHCTGGDSYLKKLKNQVGKNSSFRTSELERFAARPGVYGSAYTNNHADAVIKPIATTAPAQTVVKKENDLLNILKDIGLDALGTIMQKQKDGTLTDPTLIKIGQAGNSVINAGVNAGQQQVEASLGQNVLKFSPWIIGGIVVVMGALVFFMARK